jgi:hypothetical protein
MSKVARSHLTVRVDPAAKAHSAFEAVQESERTGVRWTTAMVVRAWLVLGRNAWLDGKRPE